MVLAARQARLGADAEQLPDHIVPPVCRGVVEELGRAAALCAAAAGLGDLYERKSADRLQDARASLAELEQQLS